MVGGVRRRRIVARWSVGCGVGGVWCVGCEGGEEVPVRWCVVRGSGSVVWEWQEEVYSK